MQAFCKTALLHRKALFFQVNRSLYIALRLCPVQAFPISISVLMPLIDLELLENFVPPLLHEIIERDYSFFSCAP